MHWVSTGFNPEVKKTGWWWFAVVVGVSCPMVVEPERGRMGGGRHYRIKSSMDENGYRCLCQSGRCPW